MHYLWLSILLLTGYASVAQSMISRLQDAVKMLEADGQLKHGILSIYVADSKTGKSVYAKNAEIGLAPASCQKVITSVAAFELLGTNYRYQTELSYDGSIENGILKGNLHLTGSGDPSFGSWRYASTKEDLILQQIVNQVKKAGIRKIQGQLLTANGKWGSETIPDGWIWQDIGNYYGAGSSSLNWRENQYDLILKSGNIGDTCAIVSARPKLWMAELRSEVTAAAKGSGDNAFIYLPPYATAGFVRGTIPSGESAFLISGSFPNSAVQLKLTIEETLQRSGVSIEKQGSTLSSSNGARLTTLMYKFGSPPLDSINYWFLNKSVNLYGEALIKTMAVEKSGSGKTEKGLEIVNDFWSQRGIEKSAIHIVDGSGLSPQNRVTTTALVNVMLYARSRPWFTSFYNALPLINGIKMKSGSIGGSRSYTGYIKSAGGSEYSFAIIINNYNGSASEIVRKIWKLLDVMK
ncbi:MAG: D-alanyl-D-alanine carboxypeptidase/D-alanyl-D-alanine-endopeptidase [Chitinophagaceae bacterium]